MKKPTPRQLQVLELMCDGWELSVSFSWRSTPARARLQKGGIGRGGDTMRLNVSLVSNLVRADLIKIDNRDASGRYYIFTEHGIQVAKEHKFYKEQAWTKQPTPVAAAQ